MQLERFQELRQQFSHTRLIVVGDVMLDTYYWGDASRISPEAPVPVVSIDRTEYRPGGAANVAYNLHSLGSEVILAGVAGRDAAGLQLRDTLEQFALPHRLLEDARRPTTEKTRVIAASQHVVRLDRESIRPLDDQLERELISVVGELLPNVNGMILQDYHKGTLTADVIRQLCRLGREHGCPVFVDPKIDNFHLYEGVNLIKPNLTEAEHFCGHHLQSDDDLRKAGDEIRKRLETEAVLITRGPQGMDLFDEDGYHRIPTRARKVADVCGAGDTVISTYSLACLSGATRPEAAELANYSAGAVVEEMGVVPATAEMVEELLRHHAAIS
ncbi:MAG: D-glycero-beta-D-manno-heptose-7-phosphate kinase [Fidelibacterota bacterium]|nr:MAG: D-glycero-beta-D-manno-heptose-7-phosphate kinase [Candidatus Neomarinimicrobiota bacterium]